MNAFHSPKVISGEMERGGMSGTRRGESVEYRRQAEGEDRSVLSVDEDTRSAKVERGR